jgi:hypothetical protein
MASTCAQKKEKKWKKRGSSSFAFAITWPWCRRSNQKNEKGGASSFFANSWQWRLKNNKNNKRIKGAPFMPRVGDGVTKATKKNEKWGLPFYQHLAMAPKN